MTVEIPLTRGYVALIDDEDAALVSPFRWYTHQRGTYAFTQHSGQIVGAPKTVLMHRLILGIAAAGREVSADHINLNGLDNRRANLRICSHSQNMANQTGRAGAKSPFKGVRPFRGKFLVQAGPTYVGFFANEIEAALAYDAAARARWGAFARLNFPAPGEQSALIESVPESLAA